MRRFYRLCLHVYPRNFGLVFGPEMANVFDRRWEEEKQHGWFAETRLALTEIVGLLWGSLITRPQPAGVSLAAPTNITEAEALVQFHLDRTVACIASHRFAEARFHAREEDRAREQLRQFQSSSVRAA